VFIDASSQKEEKGITHPDCVNEFSSPIAAKHSTSNRVATIDAQAQGSE